MHKIVEPNLLKMFYVCWRHYHKNDLNKVPSFLTQVSAIYVEKKKN